ncbi:MAG: response regulator transcription factor [Cyanobacteria bacterium]|nr:response regulator transcription factor [Cyanobacteriota bacterium]
MNTVENDQERFSVLIADDREFFRNWLKDELSKRFNDISEIRDIGDPKGAIARANSQKPNLIFMDIEFNQDRSINGIQAAAEIWKTLKDVSIIVVSSYDDQIYLKQLLEATPEGATYGYILKDNVVRDLERAVHLVRNGEGYIDPQLSVILMNMNQGHGQLTGGQYEVLVCIALGLSDKTIAKILHLGEQAVQARLRSLYRAFNIPSKSSDSKDVGLFSSRCRAVWQGMKAGLINEAELQRLTPKLQAEIDREKLNIRI